MRHIFAKVKHCILSVFLLCIGSVLASCDSTNVTLTPDGTEPPRRLQVRNLFPFFNSVLRAENLWVAVGEGGTILTSSDGQKWDASKVRSLSTIFDLGYSKKDGWVAVGGSGTILTSSNGHRWEPALSGTEYSLRAVAHDGKKRWVAVGESGTILTSTDGRNWEPVGTSQPRLLFSVAHDGKNRWVAVGESGTILTSTDGTTWDPAVSRTVDLLRSIAHDGTSRWVAVGTGIHTSSNGIDWVPIKSKKENFYSAITFNSSYRWIAVGDGTLSRSDDGITWQPDKLIAKNFLSSVVCDKAESCIAVGERGTILTTPDCNEWSRVQSGTPYRLSSVACNEKGRCLAVGYAGTILTSLGGRDWEPVSSGTQIGLNSVAYNGKGSWIAVGDRGEIRSSSNGRRWVPVANKIKTSLQSVATDRKNRWVAVGDFGEIISSTDGQPWERADSTTTVNLSSVCSNGNGTWVAVGESGTILTSSDGTTWQQASSGISASLSAVAHDGNGLWVAVGPFVPILTSSDGLVWTPTDAGKGDLLLAVANNGKDRWLTVGQGAAYDQSSYLTSTDGQTWDLAKNASSSVLYSVAFNGLDRWVAVGEGGAILNIDVGDAVSQVTRVQFKYEKNPDVAIVSLLRPVDDSPGNLKLQVFGQGEKAVKNAGKPLVALSEAFEVPLEKVSSLIEIPLKPLDPLLLADQNFHVEIRTEEDGWVSRFPPTGLSELTSRDTKVSGLLWPPSFLWVAYIFLACSLFALLLYALNPLALLKLEQILANFGPLSALKVPKTDFTLGQTFHILSFFLVPYLASRSRTLQTWIDVNRENWKLEWESQPTVQKCAAFSPLPVKHVSLQSEPVQGEPSLEWFRGQFPELGPIEIIGPGGAGKTMLAIQIGRWLINGYIGDAKLPVLIEDDIDVKPSEAGKELVRIIRDQLSLAELSPKPDDDLVKRLLRGGFLIPIFDRLSERSSATLSAVDEASRQLQIRSALITTRQTGVYKGWSPTRLSPVPLDKDSTLAFLTSLFETDSRAKDFTIAQRGTLIVKMSEAMSVGGEEQTVLPLFVRLFFDSAMELHANGQPLEALPKSIPDAFYDFVNRTNPDSKGVMNAFTYSEVRRAAGILGLASLGADYVPRDIHIDVAEPLLSPKDWNGRNPLERLIQNGIVRKTEKGAVNSLAFTYDPIAEYLAADWKITQLTDQAKCEQFLEEIRKLSSAAGFVAAFEYTFAIRFPNS